MSEQVSEGPWLHLYADGLLSKWGFGDGDEPDWLLDYCDEHGLPYPESWHDVLRALVRAYLVPALDQRVEVYDIETIHNPIRAAAVDGVPVPDAVMYGDQEGPTLTPVAIEVPLSAVLAAIEASPVPAPENATSQASGTFQPTPETRCGGEETR